MGGSAWPDKHGGESPRPERRPLLRSDVPVLIIFLLSVFFFVVAVTTTSPYVSEEAV